MIVLPCSPWTTNLVQAACQFGTLRYTIVLYEPLDPDAPKENVAIVYFDMPNVTPLGKLPGIENRAKSYQVSRLTEGTAKRPRCQPFHQVRCSLKPFLCLAILAIVTGSGKRW